MVSVPVCGAFVGRAAEVSALQSAYADTSTHTVLIAGEAGLGKSRLVSEFTTRLGTDAVVLVGRCPEFSRDGVPYAPFLSVLRSLVRELGVTRLAELLPVARPALSRWLPELAAQAGSADAESDRIRLFGEILTVLEQLALTRPVVVVLEDLHWSDDSSRELLSFLLANLAQRDLLLVGTYRPADSEPLRRLVGGLRRNPGVRLLDPAPLTRHEVGRQLAALLGREPEPGAVARIFERSKGIPLFVEALSRSSDNTPAELSDLLLDYQASLPPDAEALLRLAAVAGSPVQHALLESATELDEAALERAVRELIDRQLLLATETGYEFRHVLIRDAVYDHLLPIERKRLHARLALALHARRDPRDDDWPIGQLAHHACAAGDLPRAIEASWGAAANAASMGAHSDRRRHLDRVLELWDRVPEAAVLVAADRLTVLEQVVEASYLGGIVDRGIEAADEALGMVDPDRSPLRAAQLHYHRAGLKNQSSNGCDDDLTEALALLPAHTPTVLRGEVLAELAATRVFRGDTGGAERDARAAVEVAEQLGAQALAARGYAYLGLACAARSDTALAYFDKAHAAATAAADPQTLLTVVLWESATLVAAGEYTVAIEAIQQGIRAAHATFRFVEAGPILLVKWTQALTALGRWSEALDLIDESLTEQLPPLSKAALLLCHARIALAQGNAAAAASSADTAASLLSDGPWARRYQVQLRTIQADIAITSGQPRRAAEILTATLHADDITVHHHEVWPLLAVTARIGDIAIDVDSFAAALPVTTPVDVAYRAVATAARSESAPAWDAAVSSWRAVRQPYELARSLLGSAGAELAAGNRATAHTALREAADLAGQLAASTLADAASQLADRAGLAIDGPSRTVTAAAARPSTFGLTPRELDVLRLVAKGLSNRQIAAELFISGNTAGVHVSRILTKLGAATRTEAAAAALRHRLFPTDEH
ncbi:AAA family ATPase [Nocardia sp. NPDC051463]|uniref:ATP-binding protein n=1 Tax=Nocardia sp. NPDC051463 TaxID=3154845 RepID=UPI00341DAF87